VAIPDAIRATTDLAEACRLRDDDRMMSHAVRDDGAPPLPAEAILVSAVGYRTRHGQDDGRGDHEVLPSRITRASPCMTVVCREVMSTYNRDDRVPRGAYAIAVQNHLLPWFRYCSRPTCSASIGGAIKNDRDRSAVGRMGLATRPRRAMTRGLAEITDRRSPRANPLTFSGSPGWATWC
jgi:hypothetical protein